MRDTAEIFGFTFDIQMRYLVYMRYLWSVAMKLKFDRCAIIIISIFRAPPPPLKVLATSLRTSVSYNHGCYRFLL